MSGLFRSSVIKGTRITDFSQTTATVGVPIPFGYGRFTSGGNVIWAPLPPKEHRSVQRQGKGGVKQETFTYTLSYAVAFAKGPIFGYWWIKRNGKVVWTQDPAAPIEDRAYAAKWQQRATFYNGTMDQLPDSTIESYEGSGQVSAFHRLAYIVVEDDDVTEGGGAVPTYEACVIASPPNIYLTSTPYVIEDFGSVDVALSAQRGTVFSDPYDYMGVSLAALDGTLRAVVQDLKGQPTEVWEVAGLAALDGTMSGYTRKDYALGDIMDVGLSALGGTIKTVVVVYSNYAMESIDVSPRALNGTLT